MKQKFFYKNLLLLACSLLMIPSFSSSSLGATGSKNKLPVLNFKLELGPIANYGATPWYTSELHMGKSAINFTLDTGTTLFWATTTDCESVACKAHPRVDSSQSEYRKLISPNYPKTVDFGPWGEMRVDLASVPLNKDGKEVYRVQFAAASNYSGSEFEYLNWSGGIGLPSDTSFVDSEQTAFLPLLLKKQIIKRPIFSRSVDPKQKTGKFVFGAESENRDQRSAVHLPAKKSNIEGFRYLWGTNLIGVSIGKTRLAPLDDSILYLDTGSSRFKGNAENVEPILKEFYKYEKYGERIFEVINDSENQNIIGLKYANGTKPSDYEGILPNFNINTGVSCGQQRGYVTIALSPEQYSYKIEKGELKEE